MKILYLMSSASLFGGTPKKTLDLIAHLKHESFVYFWSNDGLDYHKEYIKAGANIYVGDFKKNIYSHLKLLLKIIDKNKIRLIQTQFPFGELLAFLLKKRRSKTITIITFEGSVSSSGLKKIILSRIYKRIDCFVYISEFVKNEKTKAFRVLKNKQSVTIYNGALQRSINSKSPIKIKKKMIFDVAGLIKLKNIMILLNAVYIIVTKHKRNDVYLYIAGDGPMKKELEDKIEQLNLKKNIHLLGYQKNIGFILDQCDVFVHPSYAEGFGIAVAEAMHAKKPIIVANAGALPELIENERSGLVIDPFNANAWADSILKLLDNKTLSDTLARNAKIRAQNLFSIERFADEYDKLYKQLLNK